MPGRQSHGRAPSKKPKVRADSKSKKRSQDAYAIALAENPDKIKIRQSRLGASEGGNRPGKRARDEDEDDEDEEEATSKKPRKSAPKGRFDELDVDEGSDSEGNEWKLGQVDSDDDSDLDSDEAFGESDEERFEDFTFAGSLDKKSKKKRRSNRDVNLDEEDDDEESDSELEEGDLGEDAIDLAAMLDATAEDDEIETAGNAQTSGSEEGDSADESADSASDDESEISSADSDDMSESAAVQNLIADLPQGATSTKRSRKSENSAPTGSGLPAIDMAAMNLLDEPKGKSKRKAGKEVMDVPLARRQQDRLDRSAAYEATKQTLARWTDTVKHNRRADHLIFPLPDQDTISAQNNSRLQPVQMSKPLDGLEATIQTILEESGQAPKDGEDNEDRLRQFEELAEKKMSVEEVKANRARLRMARELMFREEAKSKRIKKIKSKSYRKVHRKQREKEERLEKEALAEGGFVPSEDEQEAQDRRRATERMGAKHRGSKWAKEMKKTGRTAWDDEVRTGTTDMARLDEELRKRKDGRSVRKEDDDSETSSSESEQDDDEDEEAAEQRHILRQLNKVGDSEMMDDSLPGARLSNMKFMRNADAARKKENDAMVEDIRRQLAGEDSSSEEEDQDIGRRIFGPGSKKTQGSKPSAASKLNEFEEPLPSDEEDDHIELEVRGVDNGPKGTASKLKTQTTKGPIHSLERHLSKTEPEATSGGAWSKVISKSDAINNAEAKRRRHKSNNAVDIELDLSQAAVIANQFKPKKPAKKTSTTLDVGSEEDSDDDNASGLPFAIRDVELIKRAFAGDDVVTDFEAEKKQTIRDEDEKIVDNTLPGWGSWAGDGLSKREQKRGQKKDLTKVAGIKEKERKDSKLKGVIINQSRIKKNVKYMASALPHQFETRQQYERSLRLPIGPEWSTKETFQDATKPRILLKQGVIAPMSKPLL